MQTRCKNTCGENENCVINIDGGIDCRCRPGFGRKDQHPTARCASKLFVSDRSPNYKRLQVSKINLINMTSLCSVKCTLQFT